MGAVISPSTMALRPGLSLIARQGGNLTQQYRSISASNVLLDSPVWVRMQPQPVQKIYKSFKDLEDSTGIEPVKNEIEVDANTKVHALSGVPKIQIETRKVLIKKPTKNAMQSGTSNLKGWVMEFDAKERFDNTLVLGWCSTADPLPNMRNQ